MELLINGKFTDEELKETEVLFRELKVSVHRYSTKGIEAEEIVRAIFRDFDALTLIRDGIIFEIILLYTRKFLGWVRNKKPEAKIQITFNLSFGNDKPVVMISIPEQIEKDSKFITQLKICLTEDFVDSLKKGEIVSVLWDEDNQEIKIIRF